MDWVLGVVLDRLQEYETAMKTRKVSESVIRSKLTGEDVVRKLREVDAVDPQLRTPEDRETKRRRR